MILGIHYFITKLKTKIDVSQGAVLRLLICYTGQLGDNKTVEIGSIAIHVRSYHLTL